MSEGGDAAGASIPASAESLTDSGKVVERTRREWICRPEEFLSPEAEIAVGVGFAALTRGTWVIYEETDRAESRPMTVAEADDLAQREPHHEWCIHFVGPGQERHYRRVGPGQWKLYRWGVGFGNPSGSTMRRRRISGEAHRG
jgi:hypothetical protein